MDSYQQAAYNSKQKINALSGKTVDTVVGSGKNKVVTTWTVVNNHDPPIPIQTRSKAHLGIRSQKVLDDLDESDLPLADLYLYLSYKDGEWKRWLRKMNEKIVLINERSERKITPFMPREFLICHALLIGASDCNERGRMLWSEDDNMSRHSQVWQSIASKTTFSPFIKLYRFKQFRKCVACMWEDNEERAASDPWYKFRGAVENFNLIRKHDILTSEKHILDESMSSYRPRVTKLGGLPNISYILRKPEPLGTEFKTAVCPTLQVMTHMEICEGKEAMKSKPFQKDLGGTAACVVRMAQGTCQSSVDNRVEIVKGDSWFGSVKSVVSSATLCQHKKESIFQVKTAHRHFPKAFIEDVLKGEPGGARIVLKGEVGGVKLVAIGYKYNKKRVLHFIMSENAGSTSDGDPYEMKFPDEYGNINIREISRPEVVSAYFNDSNCVDVHNQLRQYALKLEKKWVTTNPYFRLHTTLTGINVVDCFQLATFHELIGRNMLVYENEVEDAERNVYAIRKFGGILAKQLLIMAQELKKGRREEATSRLSARMNWMRPADELLSSQDSNVINEEDEETRSVKSKEETLDINTLKGKRKANAIEQENDSLLVYSLTDRMGTTHHAMKFEKKVQKEGIGCGKAYTPSKSCSFHQCKRQTRVYCMSCNKTFCFSLKNDNDEGVANSCFVKHVNEIKRRSSRW
jgi:hypothetical protein